MRVIVNDLSFRYVIYSEDDAVKKVIQFIHLCHMIESGKLKNVSKLVLAGEIDVNFEIAPGCKIMKLLQKILPREERGYLLGILTNREFVTPFPSNAFICDEKESYACAAAKDDGIVVSLLSSILFSQNSIEGSIAGEDVGVRNVACEQHIYDYRMILGKRIYRANSGKHKKERWNAYGKGKVGSPMDLNDEEAQILLDHAIEYKGRLYGRKDGKNYSFQNEQDVIYHGYQDENLGDDVVRELDKYLW